MSLETGRQLLRNGIVSPSDVAGTGRLILR